MVLVGIFKACDAVTANKACEDDIAFNATDAVPANDPVNDEPLIEPFDLMNKPKLLPNPSSNKVGVLGTMPVFVDKWITPP
jgi:hypothetical protein